MPELLWDTPIHKILVIQFRQIGDVLLSTPFVRILRSVFPEAGIDFLTEEGPAQILAGNNNISSVIVFRYRKEHLKALRFYRNLKNEAYDLTFDLQGTTGTALASWFSGARHRVGYKVRGRRHAYTIEVDPPGEGEYTALNRLSLLDAVGIHQKEWRIDLCLTPEDRISAERFIEGLGWRTRFVMAISPTSRRQTRRWRAGGFASTARLFIKKYNARVLLLWGPGEEDYVRSIMKDVGDGAAMIPPSGMKEMGAYVERADILVTNNNGPKHVATALGIPTVTIYGSSSEKAWNPPDRINHKVVKAHIPCIGCHLSYCGHLSCMDLVDEYDVEQAVLGIPGMGERLENKCS